MHKGFYTDVMQQRPALFATMLAFNGLTKASSAASTMNHGQNDCEQGTTSTSTQNACHQILSTIQGLSPSAITALATSSVVQRHIQRASSPSQELSFSETLQSPPTYFWDFAEESRRLIFLSTQELTTLMQCFGVAINAQYYAHMVNRADVVTLQRALGAEMYAYGLVRGRFQVGAVANFFRTSTQALDVEAILHNIQRDGEVALALCMTTWPEQLQERLYTLLGRRIASIHDVDAAMVRGVWFIVKKLLLREVAPKWAPCFD